MNFNNIFNEIAKIDPEVFEKTDQRRNMLKNMGRKVALTALPFALGSMFQKAYGKTTNETIDNLNYLLSLGQLELAFYQQAIADASSLFSSSTAQVFTTIRDHEAAHVNTLSTTIAAVGGTPIASNANGYDFTLGGTLSTFTDYKTLLAVAQVLKDTIVRAYKGQLTMFMNNDIISLTKLMNIHSVEARHASHIRQMRATVAGGSASVKPWITLNLSGVDNSVFNASYIGEEKVVQAGITITGIGGKDVTKATASEAFDEPLTKDEIIAIITPFIVP